MHSRRSLVVLSLVSIAACDPPSAPSSRDAAADATPDVAARDVAAPDASEDPPLDGAVAARSLVRAATSDTWSTTATLAPVATRAALDAHLRAVAQRRAEERARLQALVQQRRREALANAQGALSEPVVPVPTGVAGGALAGSAETASSERRAAGAPAAARGRAAPAQSTTTANSNSITNNQVANVDEGDIVKAAGDDLIILRRGHLFRVSTANNTVRRVGHAPAFAPATQPGDWYDELLVDGDIALVLGYSYRAEATEVNRFKLEPGGAIRYLDTFYLRSDDYYSSENYATRLVNGRFVMYVPIALTGYDGEPREPRMPAMRLGRAGAFQSILEFSSVFATSGDRESSTLHAVLTCDVHSARVGCTARGVLGASSRTFYVSNTAVYVWTQAESAVYNPFATAAERAEQSRSWIVRMPHAADSQPGAAQIRGGPVDQFAFDERDGALHLLLRDEASSDAMWSSRGASGGVSAVKIPVSRMTGVVSEAPAEAFTALVAVPSYGQFKERWVGEYAIFATSSGGYASHWRRGPVERSSPRLFAYRASDQRLFELRTDRAIERIEPLGRDALVVGGNGDSLQLTPIALDSALPEPYAPLNLPHRAQGESRSHGFFFNPSGAREGVFGIATTGDSSDGESMGSSDVSFFRLRNLALSSIGTVSARPSRDNRCSTSCFDWYGNTRPIFWGDRVFALMGDEVVEAALSERSLTERHRLDFGRGIRGVVEE
ncbi:MAG: beta-propeller domain-containing protein [Polyangiales bacterium]